METMVVTGDGGLGPRHAPVPPPLPRRALLRGGLGAAVGCFLLPARDAWAELPTSGPEVPETRLFDEEVLKYMREMKIPGGSVGVLRHGRLVHARGYGWADREAALPAMPDTLFRIASISKTITSVAVLLAVQDELGGLKLDTPALPFLQLEPAVLPGGRPDPRLDRITLRHLLQHTGGWDRKQSGDPMFRYFEASRALGIPSPPPLRQFLRWALARPLENEPGTKHAYSNLGFSLLGRAIERAAGRGYEQFCRDRVLRPAGCARMRIGRDRRRDRLPGETVYYDTDDKKVANIHEADGEREVPSPYGFATMENMDAFGGWVGSTVDLLRFLRAVEPDGPSPLLNRGAYDLMLQRPAGLAGRDSQGKELPVYYGLGWNVTPLSGGLMNYGHGGAMPGTSSLFYRIQSGTGWAAIFNARPEKGNLNSLLYRAAAQVKSWPEKDLFPDFA